MSKKSISDYANEISIAKENFRIQEKEILILVRDIHSKEIDIQDKLTELHSTAVKYFELVEQSISQFSFLKYFLNENIKNAKLDEANSVANTITKYWKLIDLFNEKFSSITKINNGEKVYFIIQSFIGTYENKENVSKLIEKFENTNLPIDGFNRNFMNITRKQQITFGSITGLILLLVLLAIAFFKDCPSEFQNKIFTIVLALAAASFASIIPGILNIKVKEIITASGALAIFVMVFLMKPTELSDLKPCEEEDIEGTVYFDNKSAESIDILFPKQSKSTKSDNFGNFKLALDFSSIDETLKIHLKNKKLALDTVLIFNKSEVTKSLDIYIKTYCVECTQKDSTNVIVNSKRYCSANRKAIEGYISGFTKAGIKQGRTVECKKE